MLPRCRARTIFNMILILTTIFRFYELKMSSIQHKFTRVGGNYQELSYDRIISTRETVGFHLKRQVNIMASHTRGSFINALINNGLGWSDQRKSQNKTTRKIKINFY